MELSKYILVEWEGENKFSVISRSKIVEEEFRELVDDVMIGKVILCQWRNKSNYLAKVIQCGEKVNLNYEMNLLTRQVASIQDGESQRQQERMRVSENIIRTVTESQDQHQEDLTDYKELYELEQIRSSKFKNRVKSLKRKLREYEAEKEDEVVRLSEGVSVKKSQLDMLKTISLNANVFARNLMRTIFTNEELSGRSLFGKKCNANSSPAKESIDSERRDAIILHTMDVYCEGRRDKATLKEVRRSMGDFIREVTRANRRNSMPA